MSGRYRARGDDWAEQEKWEPDDTDARCLLELRSRVEALERRCKDEPPTLQEAQANKVHHEAELAGLEAWRRQHLIQAREVVAGEAEPEPLTTDEELYRTYMLDTGPDTVVDGLRAVYDLGRQHGAAQPAPAVKESLTAAPPPLRCPGAHTIAECGGPCKQDFRLCDCGLLQQLNPAPAVKESLTAAPAGSLVERLAWIIEPGDPLVWRGTCGLILREVAVWLRKNDSEREMGGDAAATADLIEQEASR